MIGSLGKTIYEYQELDGNNEHIGNHIKNIDEIAVWNNESQFPKSGAVTETLGTEDVVPVVVPAVPISEISVGNETTLSERTENQASIHPVPAVTVVPKKDTPDTIQIPKGHGILRLADLVGERETRTLYREQCFWCKSKDFWLIDPQDPQSRVCRRCHPPPVMNTHTKKN